jgi:hypothetical protein
MEIVDDFFNENNPHAILQDQSIARKDAGGSSSGGQINSGGIRKQTTISKNEEKGGSS